jgi:hypothetical protein
MFASCPSELRKRVHALATRPRDRFLELGACLNALHAVSPAAQFRDAVKIAGLGGRKAYYLINIAERFRPHMRFRSRLQKIGWTKCQMISAQLPEGNFLELLEYAEEHTAKDLDTYLRRKRATVGTRCVLLYFTPGEYRRYEEAALKCGARRRGRGIIDKELATVRMAKKVLSG